MPSQNKTTNYGLNQWQGNEYVKRQDFVDDNMIIDAALSPEADPAKAPSSNGPFKVVDWVSYFTNRIKAIVGKTNWWDAPTKSLEQLNGDTTSHLLDSVKHITSAERTAWNNKLDASNYTASDILTKIKTIDGSGSSLDADKLDGLQAASFLRSDAADSATSLITFVDGLHVASASNTKPLTVGRGSNTSNEVLKIGVEDGIAHLKYFNDESSSRLRFTLENTDTEANSGASANTRYLDIYSDSIDMNMYIANRKVWHEGLLRVKDGQLEFYDGGVWQSVGIQPTKPRTVDFYSVIDISTTLPYTTILNVAGKGVLNRGNLYVYGINNNNSKVKITIDGSSYEVTQSTQIGSLVTRGLHGTDNIVPNHGIWYTGPVYFTTSLKVEVYTYNSNSMNTRPCYASVDYALV